jgi:hypothetical protein
MISGSFSTVHTFPRPGFAALQGTVSAMIRPPPIGLPTDAARPAGAASVTVPPPRVVMGSDARSDHVASPHRDARHRMRH